MRCNRTIPIRRIASLASVNVACTLLCRNPVSCTSPSSLGTSTSPGSSRSLSLSTATQSEGEKNLENHNKAEFCILKSHQA